MRAIFEGGLKIDADRQMPSHSAGLRCASDYPRGNSSGEMISSRSPA